MEKCQTLLQPQNIIFYWFRALFSRDEEYRNEASTRLESHIGVPSSILNNLFVFPSSILSQMMSQDESCIYNAAPTLSIDVRLFLLLLIERWL